MKDFIEIPVEHEKLREEVYEKLAKLGHSNVRGIMLGDNPGSADAVVAEVLRVIGKIEEFQALPVEEQMRKDMEDIYCDLYKALHNPKDHFCAIDMALVMLGNWVSGEVRNKARVHRYSEDKGLGPQVRSIEEILSLHNVVLDHFKKEGYHPDTLDAMEGNINKTDIADNLIDTHLGYSSEA